MTGPEDRIDDQQDPTDDNGEDVTDKTPENHAEEHTEDPVLSDSGTGEDVEIDLGTESYATADDEVSLDFGAEDYRGGEEVEVDLDFASTADSQDEESSDELNLDFESEAEAEQSEAEDEEADSLEALTEKALEELREELRGKYGDWYVVHTYSGMENRVAQNLENRVSSLNMEDYIFEVRVPTEEVTELRNGVKKNVKRTVLPGYVLVRMDLTDQSWSTVRHTPSVTGFVGHSNQPIPLSLEEVEKMLAPAVVAATQAANSSGPARPKKKKQIEVADFDEGDSVMVVEGPFAGVHATITEINVSSQRLKALVEILGRETPVDLTFAQIQKV